jgi:hypothetical protein
MEDKTMFDYSDVTSRTKDSVSKSRKNTTYYGTNVNEHMDPEKKREKKREGGEGCVVYLYLLYGDTGSSFKLCVM